LSRSATHTVGQVLAGFAALPVTEPALGRFAVLAPHPDDESLGCGGLIARACAAGQPPVVIILTDGAGSHPESRAYPPAALARVRQAETAAAMACLGLPPECLHFLGCPDGKADQADHSALSAQVAALAAGCPALLTTWRHDPHPDHQAAAAIAAVAAARLGAVLWEYPVWGWTLDPAQALPDTPWHGCRVDISAFLAQKRRAVAAHASQHGQVVHDAPDGFVLPPDFLALFDGPFETLVRAA
jgi:LmbE family N-acetylglucosaminyl deacetylase